MCVLPNTQTGLPTYLPTYLLTITYYNTNLLTGWRTDSIRAKFLTHTLFSSNSSSSGSPIGLNIKATAASCSWVSATRATALFRLHGLRPMLGWNRDATVIGVRGRVDRVRTLLPSDGDPASSCCCCCCCCCCCSCCCRCCICNCICNCCCCCDRTCCGG